MKIACGSIERWGMNSWILAFHSLLNLHNQAENRLSTQLNFDFVANIRCYLIHRIHGNYFVQNSKPFDNLSLLAATLQLHFNCRKFLSRFAFGVTSFGIESEHIQKIKWNKNINAIERIHSVQKKHECEHKTVKTETAKRICFNHLLLLVHSVAVTFVYCDTTHRCSSGKLAKSY